MNGTSKARRQQAILELVRSRPVASQEELAQRLGTHGHTVAQSTLSRDLKELRVFRVPVGGGYRYLPAGEESAAPPMPPALGGVAAAEVVAVDANEVAVVVRTQVGHAQGVAVYLDGLRLPEVLATLAGDDTILVLPASTRRTTALKRRLRELFLLGPSDFAQPAPGSGAR
jgi:transcriptional regulator of arginine metabolism